METSPWPLFSAWLEDATRAEPSVPESMQLATVSPEGIPSLRTVLLKAHGPEGLVFYTNLGSQKARELEQNPWCAFLFHYKAHARQVRGEGRAHPVSEAEADAYFASRPRGSQLGAWASRQSCPIPSREALMEAVSAMEARFAGRPVPRPPFWSGYRIVPERIEFWQGREDRLHDRIQFTRTAEGWERVLLAP